MGLGHAKEFYFPGLDKYQNDPTTTSLETTDFPIWEIDFPGVTICPNAKVGKVNSIPANHIQINIFIISAVHKQI